MNSDARTKLLNDCFTTATTAARQSGALLKENFDAEKEINFKGRIDVVTNVDVASEKIIMDLIAERHSGHEFITEETDTDLSGAPYRWIIDPLDGTVNYAHSYPFCCVSIAFELDGVIELGVVYDPIYEQFFTARRGEGAFYNDRPIRVSGIDSIERSLLATGFPYDIRENPFNNLLHFSHMATRAQAIRRDGSAALNLCYTAMGRFEGYWELTISPWDIAAGVLIVEEAGGRISCLDGGKHSVYDRQVVATNGLIHDELVACIQDVNREHYPDRV